MPKSTIFLVFMNKTQISLFALAAVSLPAKCDDRLFLLLRSMIWAGGASNGSRARVWRQVQIHTEEKAAVTHHTIEVLAGPRCAYLRSGIRSSYHERKQDLSTARKRDHI